MKSLTQKQQSMLEYIADFTKKEGMPPTVYELAEHFQIRAPTAFAHLRALQRKGYISRSSKARSLTLLQSDTPRHLSLTLSVPVLGRISAGMPLFAEEHVEETLQVDPASLPKEVHSENIFGLKVTGDSMYEAGILDGDTLIARQTETAKDGDIVVALVEDSETTVKYLYLTDKGIELRPANAAYSTQIYSPEKVHIQGVALALQRTF